MANYFAKVATFIVALLIISQMTDYAVAPDGGAAHGGAHQGNGGGNDYFSAGAGGRPGIVRGGVQYDLSWSVFTWTHISLQSAHSSTRLFGTPDSRDTCLSVYAAEKAV
ncbi:hypothetical protein Ddc_24512 [Ditylenchus destructor]|nr:hypothetical protein Ddc_24512 [Ditylenchus destructor]